MIAGLARGFVTVLLAITLGAWGADHLAHGASGLQHDPAGWKRWAHLAVDLGTMVSATFLIWRGTGE